MIQEQTARDDMERRLAYLSDQTKRQIRRREEDLIRALARHYEAAAQDMDALVVSAFRQYGAPATWSLTDYGAAQRNAWLLDQIVTRTDTLYGQVTPELSRGLLHSYQEGLALRGWTLSQLLPSGVFMLPIIPEPAIMAALAFPYEGATFFERMGDARADFIRKLRRTITVSQIEGEGIYSVQKRLAKEVGWPISRRKRAEAVANKGNFARTEMIARTEMLRASNLGAAAVDDTRQELLSGWEWITARDERVCPICGPLDEKVWPIGQGERPPKHPRCRCGSLPVLKSAADLGLPVDPRDYFPARKTYREWAKEHGVTVPD